MESNNINDRARESALKAKKMPASVQYAIVQVLPNILNGAFWGFTDIRDIKDHVNELREDKNITARKLGNACLIEVVPQYLLKAVSVIDPNAINKKDIDVMTESMVKATMEFEKFLLRKGKKGFVGTIGIYCINDVSTISYKGVSYPAFRLSMDSALKILAQYGYTIQVKGNFMTPQQASQAGQDLWDSAQLSPTKTGIFITVRSTLSEEQLKSLESDFKSKYGLK